MSTLLRIVGVFQLLAALFGIRTLVAADTAALMGQQALMKMGAAALFEGFSICLICWALASLLDQIEWKGSTRAAGSSRLDEQTLRELNAIRAVRPS